MGTRIHKLTAKALYELIKRGCTLEDFCNKYQCDEAALRDRIRRLLHNHEQHTSEAFSAIIANGKRPNVSARANKVSEEVKVEVDEAVKSPVAAEVEVATPVAAENEAEDETNVISETEVRPEDTAVTESVLRRDSALEDLQESLQRLLENENDLAREYTSLDRLFGEKSNSILSLQGKIEELKTTLAGCEFELAGLKNERDILFDDRKAADEKRKENAARIESVKAKILELSTIQLIVYNDGRIETLDTPNFVPDDTGAKELAARLLESEEHENLRVKDIRLLARVLKIEENAGYPVRSMFDSEELQNHYEEIKDSLLYN